MRLFLALLASFIFAFANMPKVNLKNAEIYGIYKDYENSEIAQFLGIPYAKAPVGDLRWKKPQNLELKGKFLAQEFGDFCPQNADLGDFAVAGGDEDCLNLNIYVKKDNLNKNAKKPVMVWIHGGSLWVGRNSDYDGSRFAKNDAVLVSINYRLGMFGFFAHPELKNSTNFGMFDQIKALEWIKENIENFGGDKDNITIFGESSGGVSVISHLISPLSKGKFNHAISMSGAAIVGRYPAFGTPYPLEVAQRIGAEFGEFKGCKNLKCLKNLSSDEILKNSFKYQINMPVIDKEFFPYHPADMLENGEFNRVTFANGNTRDEGRFFTAIMENLFKKPMDQKSFNETLNGYLQPNLAQKTKEFFKDEIKKDPVDAYAKIQTSLMFACSGKRVNDLVSKFMPVYAYEFNDATAPSYLEKVSFDLKAAHTLELPYLFPNFHGGGLLATRLDKNQLSLANNMVKNFINLSDISKTDFVKYEPNLENILIFQQPKPYVEKNLHSTRHNCKFWDESGAY